MTRWLSSEVPEWVTLLLLVVGVPAVMVLLQMLVHKRFPHWRRGEHNDAAGIMLSAAAVVYSVSIGLCVITLWDNYEQAQVAAEAEASNLAALADGAAVLADPAGADIRAGVLAYNEHVVQYWPERMAGIGADAVSRDLAALVAAVGRIEAETDAQRAFVDDATARLAGAVELRATSLRLAHDQQLPSVLWVAVLGGSVIVLGLCLTCGVRDRALRVVLIAGVAAIVGMNLFLVVELNYPFYGDVAITPESFQDVVAQLRSTG
ncbi:MAG TPA: hypothetical protein VFO77_01915 [Actinoplanes sp.]|nr:hypothetical protein [Actinoplanes sp.]